MFFSLLLVQDIKHMFGYVARYRVFEPAILCVAIFIGMLSWPSYEHSVRRNFMVALFKVLAAPFFKVQFVHFFIADVMTSLTTILIDITSFACFFTIEDYASATH